MPIGSPLVLHAKRVPEVPATAHETNWDFSSVGICFINFILLAAQSPDFSRLVEYGIDAV